MLLTAVAPEALVSKSSCSWPVPHAQVQLSGLSRLPFIQLLLLQSSVHLFFVLVGLSF